MMPPRFIYWLTFVLTAFGLLALVGLGFCFLSGCASLTTRHADETWERIGFNPSP